MKSDRMRKKTVLRIRTLYTLYSYRYGDVYIKEICISMYIYEHRECIYICR